MYLQWSLYILIWLLQCWQISSPNKFHKWENSLNDITTSLLNFVIKILFVFYHIIVVLLNDQCYMVNNIWFWSADCWEILFAIFQVTLTQDECTRSLILRCDWKIKVISLEIQLHLSYSSDLTPSDFFLFLELKKSLWSQRIW